MDELNHLASEVERLKCELACAQDTGLWAVQAEVAHRAAYGHVVGEIRRALSGACRRGDSLEWLSYTASAVVGCCAEVALADGAKKIEDAAKALRRRLLSYRG